MHIARCPSARNGSGCSFVAEAAIGPATGGRSRTKTRRPLLSPLLFRGFSTTDCGQNVPLSKVLIGIHPVAALAGNSGA